MRDFYAWRPYVSVAERRSKALREMEKLRKKGKQIEPVQTQGRTIAESFWGRAWCRHLEKFSDFANRLPRGRTYVRNGSVCHLEMAEGTVEAIVSGSELYTVSVRVRKLPPDRWSNLKGRCMEGIGSLLELLQGKLSSGVMEVVTDREKGLFPRPREMDFDCSCPDYADMCKHVAAVLYGVGARLDARPELLFLLRGVKPEDLVSEQAVPNVVDRRRGRRIVGGDLSEVFGIELAKGPVAATGQAVSALRRKFGMTRSQFARLLGVSGTLIGVWEENRGALALRARSLRAWTEASTLDKAAAWDRLNGAR